MNSYYQVAYVQITSKVQSRYCTQFTEEGRREERIDAFVLGWLNVEPSIWKARTVVTS